MTRDIQEPKRPLPPRAKYVAATTWDGDLWNVRVPGHDGDDVTFTTAENLAEVVPNTSVVLGVVLDASPMHLVGDIGVEVRLPDEIVKALLVAADLVDEASAELRRIGLGEADIATVLAGDPSMSGRPKPCTPVPLLRSHDPRPTTTEPGFPKTGRSPESLTMVLARAAERLRSDPAANFDHGAVRGVLQVLADRLNNRLAPPRPPSGEGRDDVERP